MSRFLIDDTPSWVRGLRGAAATGAGIERMTQVRREQARREKSDADARGFNERGFKLRESADARAAESHKLGLQQAQRELIDEELARRLKRRQAVAELAWDEMRLKTLQGRAPKPITPSGPLTGAVSAGMAAMGQQQNQMSDRVREQILQLPPEQREGAMQFLQQKQSERLNAQETRRLVGEIQAAMEPPDGVEPWLSPEQGQQMIDDLQDANRPDIGTKEVRQLLDKQRTFVRNLRVARETFSANFAAAKAATLQPEPDPTLGISRAEWLRRRRDANVALQEWGTNWAAWDPDAKYAEVMDILKSRPKHDPIEVRKSVLENLRDDPAYLELETPEERARYRDEAFRWMMTGAAAPEQAPRVEFGPHAMSGREPIGYQHKPPVAMEELQQTLLEAVNSEDPTAAVAQALEEAGAKASDLPRDFREKLVQRAEGATARARRALAGGPPPGTGYIPGRDMPAEFSGDDIERMQDAVQRRRAGQQPLTDAQWAARSNANAATPGRLARAGGARGGPAGAAMGAAAEIGGRVGAAGAESARRRAGGKKGTWTQLGTREREIVQRLMERDPKGARELLQRLGVDPASVPRGLMLLGR